MVDEVGIVSCAIHCIMHVRSPLGDTIAIGMCSYASVAVCHNSIVCLHDCIFANKGQRDPQLHI